MRIRLRNTGVCPWSEGVGQSVELQEDVARLGLPTRWDFVGPPMVLGDQREVELAGSHPRSQVKRRSASRFTAPFRNPYSVAETTATLRWN